MNALDVMKYGHRWVHQHVDQLDTRHWDTPGVTGWWSTRQIIAHLASFERMLCELLESQLRPIQTPTLDAFNTLDGDAFNAQQVNMRQNLTPAQTLGEYDEMYAGVARFLPDIPYHLLRQPGRLPWYGAEYDLEDFLVYAFYGHKREHCAQIAVFMDGLEKSA